MRAEMWRMTLIAALAVALGTAYMMAVLPAFLAYAAVLEPDAGPQIVFAMDRLPEPGEPVHVQAAVASWYGHPFIGRPTASGSTYTGQEFTAAHVSWPFGTWVELTHPGTGKTIAVQIDDRGPYDPNKLPKLVPHPTRELDLSVAAAEALGIVEQGVADLEARVLVWGDEATTDTRAAAR